MRMAAMSIAWDHIVLGTDQNDSGISGCCGVTEEAKRAETAPPASGASEATNTDDSI